MTVKRLLLLAGLSLAFASPTLADDADKASMHEMMMKKGAPSQDERIELKLPDAMKVMQKAMMRRHLDTVADITAALATNDLKGAAKISKDSLGWSQEEEKRCTNVSKMTGEPDFLSFGMAVHKEADALSEAATSGNRDLALQKLSTLIGACNACHKRFRH